MKSAGVLFHAGHGRGVRQQSVSGQVEGRDGADAGLTCLQGPGKT